MDTLAFTSIYCTATHPRSVDGCYEMTDHTGQHSGMYRDDMGDWESFQWDNEAPAVPEGSVAVVLTREELGILITLLAPVKQFFPVLEAKLGDTKDML